MLELQLGGSKGGGDKVRANGQKLIHQKARVFNVFRYVFLTDNENIYDERDYTVGW